MARSFAMTAVFLVLAWVLMVSYQIFTETALKSITTTLAGPSPVLASMLNSGSSVVVFICSFAWMFVLSAAVSKLMFGRERRLSIQFLVSLALTFMGSALLGLFSETGLDLANPIVLSKPFTAIFGNPIFSLLYLALPFGFMVALDVHALTKRSK